MGCWEMSTDSNRITTTPYQGTPIVVPVTMKVLPASPAPVVSTVSQATILSQGTQPISEALSHREHATLEPLSDPDGGDDVSPKLAELLRRALRPPGTKRSTFNLPSGT